MPDPQRLTLNIPARSGTPARDRESAITLALLSGVFGLQYMDQIMVGLFAEPIKHDFHLSDAEMGLITGFSFTFFYVLCGLPLARLADRADRKRIILACLVLFSAATAACGLAAGFFSLFLARVCVAVGEAGTSPATASILAQRFDPARRQMTMSIYTGAGYGGTALGLLLIGTLSDALTWRQLFLVAGLLGMVAAAVVGMVLREPERREVRESGRRMSTISAFLTLIRIASFRWMAIGIGIALIAASSAISWIPAFLIRSHGFSQSQVVLFLAVGWGGGATVGTFVFGAINARLRSLGGRKPLLVSALLVLGFAGVYCVSFLVSSLPIVLAGIVASLFMIGGLRGPVFALVQDIVPDDMQATANATMLFIIYAIGAALGPVLTGLASDLLLASQGADALRYALVIVILLSGLFGSAALLFASRHIEADILANQSGLRP